ncbi:MAG: group III truncated hemoglobin [Bacteroidota bacterium]|nr:group III truncated hemoglobin [Bacteroidota bacterium]
MKDIKDVGDIKLFVDEFYTKVKDDALIGPVFLDKIEDWQPHLDKMYAFWNAALFGVPGFKGNPFAKHAPLKIGPEHFTCWLELFYDTIDRHFEGVMATDAKNRAELMADMFLKRLQTLSGGPGKVIV